MWGGKKATDNENKSHKAERIESLQVNSLMT